MLSNQIPLARLSFQSHLFAFYLHVGSQPFLRVSPVRNFLAFPDYTRHLPLTWHCSPWLLSLEVHPILFLMKSHLSSNIQPSVTSSVLLPLTSPVARQPEKTEHITPALCPQVLGSYFSCSTFPMPDSLKSSPFFISISFPGSPLKART